MTLTDRIYDRIRKACGPYVMREGWAGLGAPC